jgi:hypothetical protein
MEVATRDGGRDSVLPCLPKCLEKKALEVGEKK